MYCEKDQVPFPRETKGRRNLDSFQVWAAGGWNFKSPLVILPKGRMTYYQAFDRRFKPPKMTTRPKKIAFRVNAQDYIKLCLNPLKKALQDHRDELLKEEGLTMRFLHDGAGPHIAGDVIQWFVDAKIEQVVNFPSYSPDLNMSELFWKDVHAGIGERRPETEEELIAALKDTWATDITQERINAHVLHFTAAVEAISD